MCWQGERQAVLQQGWQHQTMSELPCMHIWYPDEDCVRESDIMQTWGKRDTALAQQR